MEAEAEAEALHAEPEAEAKMVKNSPLPHHWFRRPDIWAFRQKFSRVLKDIVSFGSAAEKKKYKSIGIRNITSCKQRMFQWRSKGYPISTVDARGSVSGFLPLPIRLPHSLPSSTLFHPPTLLSPTLFYPTTPSLF